MSNPEDEKQPGGPSTRSSGARALVPYQSSDEIDLVEVGASLWRRWKLMAGVFLVCLGLALALAFIIPHSYEYTTTIEIGSRVVGTQVQPVESPQSAASKLKNGYLPQVVQQYAQANRVDPKKLNFDAAAPEKADLVIITGKAPRALAGSYMAIEKSAAQLLAASDARITKSQQAQLQTQLAQAQSKLDQLQDPANRKLLKSQIDSLEAYQKRAQDQQIDASRHTNGASGAMTLLLLGTQAQQSDQQLLTLQQQLNNLPSDITSQKAAVQSLKAQLDNLQMTQVIAGPIRSLDPVGLSRKLIVILGAIVGAILALFAAGVSNYIVAVRRRLAESIKLAQ